jgi:outer membrane protein TolC
MLGHVCSIAASVVMCTSVLSAQSISREQAVTLALERSPQVVAGHSQWQAARAEARLLSAPPRPELALEYEGLPAVFDLGSYSERTIGVTQRLEFPLKWWKRVTAARHDAERTRFSAYETTRQDISLAVRIAYDTALADEQRRALAASHVQLSDQVVRQVRARFEAGDVGRLDVARTEVAAGRLKNELTTARFSADRSRARLSVLLGNPPDAVLSLSDSLVCEPVVFDIDVLKRSALRRRSEISAADHGLKAAKTARGASRASVFPDLAIGVARQTSGGSGLASDTWRTGISLELPLYGFSDPAGGLSRASAKVTMAVAVREATRLRVMEEVQVGYLQFEEARERLERTLVRLLPAARVALDAARRSYEAGEASSLDYLSAQGDFVEVELGLVEAQLRYRIAESTLRHSAGEGPQEVATDPEMNQTMNKRGNDP